MKMKTISIAVVTVITLFGCKKISSDEQSAVTDNTANIKAQAWFEKQTSQLTAAFKSTAGTLKLNDAPPLWSNTKYFAAAKMLIAPVQVGDDTKNSYAAKYLVMQEDASEQVESGYYCFVLSKSSKPEAAPSLLANDIPSGFTGAIVKYSLDGSLIAATHYENGAVTDKQDKLEVRPMSKNDDGGVSPNLAPINCNGTQVCTDWYWQTYVNGVLVYEEYLFSSCTCEQPGGGGSSGGGGVNTNCQEALDAFVGQGHPFDGQMSRTNTSSNGVSWEIPYNWVIFTAGTWGVVSYEKGVLEKVTYPNMTRWEYVSLNHVSTSEIGMSIGGTRTFQLNNAVANISQSRTSAQMIIDFSVTHRVCALAPFTTTYQSVGRATAPNGVVVVPD